MKIERNYEKRYSMQNGLRSDIQYIFRSAKVHKTPFKTILESIDSRIRKSIAYSKIGEIGRANIQGHIDAHFQMMYDELDWCCWYKGKFRGLTKNFKYTRNFHQELMETAHVYKGTEIKYN